MEHAIDENSEMIREIENNGNFSPFILAKIERTIKNRKGKTGNEKK
jgi:hypothetical protein